MYAPPRALNRKFERPFATGIVLKKPVLERCTSIFRNRNITVAGPFQRISSGSDPTIQLVS